MSDHAPLGRLRGSSGGEIRIAATTPCGSWAMTAWPQPANSSTRAPGQRAARAVGVGDGDHVVEIAVERSGSAGTPVAGASAAPRGARPPSPPPGPAASPARARRGPRRRPRRTGGRSPPPSSGGKSREISRVACSRGRAGVIDEPGPGLSARRHRVGAAGVGRQQGQRRDPPAARARPAAGRRSRPSTSRPPAARSISERIQQGLEVGGHAVDRQLRLAQLRAADAAVVRADHLERLLGQAARKVGSQSSPVAA